MGIQDFVTLRQTIYEHQWKEFYPIAEKLLAINVSQSTLIIAKEMARSCLRFQQHYDLKWVTRFTDEVIKLFQTGSIEHELPSLPVELEGEFLTTPPGVSNLVAGVEAFWESFAIAHKPDEKAHYLLIALDNFVIAELCHYWAIVHPEEWELHELFWIAESDSEGQILLPPGIDRNKLYTGISFRKQPDSIGYKVAKWLRLVDELEIALAQ